MGAGPGDGAVGGGGVMGEGTTGGDGGAAGGEDESMVGRLVGGGWSNILNKRGKDNKRRKIMARRSMLGHSK